MSLACPLQCMVGRVQGGQLRSAGAALEQLDQFTPEHLSRLLWAYSTLRIYSPELYSAVSSVVTLLQTGTSRPGSMLGQIVGIESGTCAATWGCHHPCLRLTACGAERH